MSHIKGLTGSFVAVTNTERRVEAGGECGLHPRVDTSNGYEVALTKPVSDCTSFGIVFVCLVGRDSSVGIATIILPPR